MQALRHARALRKEAPCEAQIPYTALVSDRVVKTRHGDYVQVFHLGGASFETADDEQLNNWHERLNVLLRNVARDNVVVWTHVVRRTERRIAAAERSTGFADVLAAKYERRIAGETLMVNDLYLSVVYRPTTGVATGAVAKALAKTNAFESRLELKDSLETCEKLAQALLSSLDRYEPQALGGYEWQERRCSRLLEFLALLINGEWQRVPLPTAPVCAVLATTRPIFGLETIEYRMPTRTRLGAMVGIIEYSTPTSVGMLNALLSATFPFVLTQSFAFLKKSSAQGLMQRQYNRMQAAGDFAISQAEEIKDALDELTSNEWVMGDHHLTLQVLGDPSEAGDAVGRAAQVRGLNDRIAEARSLLADHTGMTVGREDLALEAAFWAQLPGNLALRPRKAPITSRNFAALSGFHNYPTGREAGNHWGEALALLITSARSPYHFSLHASDPNDPDGGSRKDTGHTFICGPTGSGKTVFIGFLVALLARRSVTQAIFDKNQGLEILVRALGGEYFALKNGIATGFNPLRLPATAATVDFLKVWLRSLVRGPLPLTTGDESDLDHALRGTLALDVDVRRLSRLIEFTDSTQGDGIYARLSRWCEVTRGDYAWVFDNADDSVASRLAGQSLVGFDVTEFLDNEVTRPPLTLYLFHRVRGLLTGRPFVCWADEFSRLLDDPSFEQFAKDGLKVWRKLNGVFCAATQSPSDALGSAISRTIIEQAPTKIYFPNADADATEYMQGFGLTEREFRLVKEQLNPGARLFLVKQGHQSIVCELNLKGFDAELAVISGRASEVERLHRIMGEVGSDPALWLPPFCAPHQRTDQVQ